MGGCIFGALVRVLRKPLSIFFAFAYTFFGVDSVTWQLLLGAIPIQENAHQIRVFRGEGACGSQAHRAPEIEAVGKPSVIRAAPIVVLTKKSGTAVLAISLG